MISGQSVLCYRGSVCDGQLVLNVATCRSAYAPNRSLLAAASREIRLITRPVREITHDQTARISWRNLICGGRNQSQISNRIAARHGAAAVRAARVAGRGLT